MVFIPRPITIPRPIVPRIPRAPRPINVYHHTTVIVHQAPAIVHYPLVFFGVSAHQPAWVWVLVVLALVVPTAGVVVFMDGDC